MLKPLILQTLESLTIPVNDDLTRWLRELGSPSIAAAKESTQAELHALMERISRMPPIPGDGTMSAMAKLALLSGAQAALDLELKGSVVGKEDEDHAREQIIRDCARAWAYTEEHSPATSSFMDRVVRTEQALRLQCGLEQSVAARPDFMDTQWPNLRRA